MRLLFVREDFSQVYVGMPFKEHSVIFCDDAKDWGLLTCSYELHYHARKEKKISFSNIC